MDWRTKFILAFAQIILGIIIFILIKDAIAFALAFILGGVGVLINMLNKKPLKYLLSSIFFVTAIYLLITYDENTTNLKDQIISEFSIHENDSIKTPKTFTK